MRRPIALLRPEPGWSTSAAAAREAGLAVVGHPIFEVEPVEWAPAEGAFDALLVGSAAVFHVGGANLAKLRHLPVHAVGEATARAAREAGFSVERVGSGGLQALLDGPVGGPMRYLRLSGEERVMLRPAPDQTIVERTVYRLNEKPLETDFVAELRKKNPVVALHSASAAIHFAAEVDRLDLGRGGQFLVALGPRIAKAAGLGWAAVHVSDMPSDNALLAKAVALCK